MSDFDFNDYHRQMNEIYHRVIERLQNAANNVRVVPDEPTYPRLATPNEEARAQGADVPAWSPEDTQPVVIPLGDDDPTPSPDDSDDLPDDWSFNHENS